MTEATHRRRLTILSEVRRLSCGRWSLLVVIGNLCEVLIGRTVCNTPVATRKGSNRALLPHALSSDTAHFVHLAKALIELFEHAGCFILVALVPAAQVLAVHPLNLSNLSYLMYPQRTPKRVRHSVVFLMQLMLRIILNL